VATVPLPSLIFCAALRLLEAVLCPRSPRAFVRLVVILVLTIVLVVFARVPMLAFELPALNPLPLVM
jgi:hypothetical protein